MSFEIEHCRNCGNTYSAGMMHECPTNSEQTLDEILNFIENYGVSSSNGMSAEMYLAKREEAKAAISTMVAGILGQIEPVADSPLHPVVDYEALHGNRLREVQLQRAREKGFNV